MGTRYYEKFKDQLKERWDEEAFTAPIFNTSKNSYTNIENQLGNKIGIKPDIFGFVVLDDARSEYNKSFRDLLMAANSQGHGIHDDPLKWATMDNGILGIPFQYIEQIPVWSKTANWNEESGIIGRFEGQSIYGNSQAQTLSLTLIYYAESSADSHMEYTDVSRFARTNNKWTLKNIERFIFQLKSLTFPQYDGYYNPPIKMLFNIGNIYVDVPVVITSISVEEPGPFEIISMRGMMKKVTLEMRTSYPSWQAISAVQVWTADSGSVFARQEFEPI